MKTKILTLLVLVTFLASCTRVPQETLTLSQTLGKDLEVLHQAHRGFVTLYYGKIKNDINSFIDDTYAPFVIHHVLKRELTAYKSGGESIYRTVEIAGQVEGKKETDAALKDMEKLLTAARSQIETKRTELLQSIMDQEAGILKSVDQSYKNVINANSTLTAYLKSTRKVKIAQKEALATIGLEDADVELSNSLVKLSEEVSKLVDMGKKVDTGSDGAYEALEKISSEIKELTTK